jgi:tRNA pseudouridine13 synthase
LSAVESAALSDAALLFRWADLPPITPLAWAIGGRVRLDPEDFLVREIPLYEPSGAGSHAYALVEKVGRTTRDLVAALHAAGVPPAAVGVAGLKDKVARTEQWLSVPRRHEAAAWAALAALPGVQLLRTDRHRNRLGIGHLRGNAFTVRIRDVLAGGPDAGEEAARRVAEACAHLRRVGLPNYFGPQRFGRGGRNAVDARAVARGELVLGDLRLRRFLLSALQSQVFNLLLADRVREGLLTTVLEGDWARKHDTGGTFLVVDAAAEAPRAEAFAISATLPLLGKKVRPTTGAAGVREAALLERVGVRFTDFVARYGDRRLARLPLGHVGIRPDEGDVVLDFELPRGAYATTLLRELTHLHVDVPEEAEP